MNSKKQINIFIVEDNKVYTMALKASIEIAFKDLPVKIHSFETGETCLRKFKNVLPELVILDYNLNSKSINAANGLQVLDKIKKSNSNTSVIMLTSNENIDIALKSFHHGASDYVVKTNNQFKNINISISNYFANKELDLQNERRIKREVELIISNKELDFKNKEEKRVAELIIVNNQKAEVEKSKQVIEKRNKDITDSIRYAKRIQQAKLPKKEEIYSALSNCFVLFKPKDIVSGDFYFFYKNNLSLFIAAADCTGHGVPGAFMSMIGSEKLATAVSLSTDTSEILKKLNKGIKESLRQSESYDSTRDGMDIALCSVDIKKRIVKFAGANRPLWIIRNGHYEIEEIKGTKKAIGGFTDDNQHFESHDLKLKKGDTFYITTDGYSDQFGGIRGRKLMTKKFKQILLEIQDMTMNEQEKHLNDFVEDWRAEEEQVDDILVIGVRL
ncbi:MAG: response regulator [Bacteroidia bacterium]|nr:response regulator [Bacteroidia bacterium]